MDQVLELIESQKHGLTDGVYLAIMNALQVVHNALKGHKQLEADARCFNYLHQLVVGDEAHDFCQGQCKGEGMHMGDGDYKGLDCQHRFVLGRVNKVLLNIARECLLNDHIWEHQVLYLNDAGEEI